MSIKISRNHSNLIIFMFMALIVLTADVFVLQAVKEGEFAQILPLAVGLDLTLVLPLLYVLMLYRNSKNKWRLLAPIMLVGYMMSKLLLNAIGIEDAKLLGYFAILLVIISITISVYHLVQKYRAYIVSQQVRKPVYDSMKERIEETFPQLKNPGYLVHELSMYYYVFFVWKKKPSIHDDVPVFSYHRKSIMLVMLFFLGFVLTAEGFAVHLLIMQHTMEVPESEKKESIAPAMDSPNVLIECIEPVEVVLMFGQKRSTTKVYLHIDEPSDFQKSINSLLK